MSSTEYAAKLPTLQAIPYAAIKKPNIPIKAYLQEAENLFQWVQQDQAQLQSAGLPWHWVQDLPTRIGALREAESLWFKERFGREEAQRQWDQDAPAAYALRDQLLRTMRYAFRHDSNLLKRVADITDGDGHADLIQDLSDIAALGSDNLAALQAVNLDMAELDKAAMAADSLGSLLGLVNGERSNNSGARIVRDQAYTHLKEAVDEVRACGQFVFWDNELRLLGYRSSYRRSYRQDTPSTPAVEGSEV